MTPVKIFVDSLYLILAQVKILHLANCQNGNLPGGPVIRYCESFFTANNRSDLLDESYYYCTT